MSKQNVSYSHIEGEGVGIGCVEVTLDHSVFTDVTTTGAYAVTSAIPPYSLRLGCVVETIEAFSSAVTVAVGITATANEWTSATTGTCTALAYKGAFVYGHATLITGGFSGSTAESVHVTLTHGTDYTLVTSGKIKLKVFYLATQN